MVTLDGALEKHVPYYLTEDQKSALVGALRAFPEKANYYSPFPESGVLQGDCYNGVPIIHFGTGARTAVDCLVLSNTCDIDPSNKRLYPTRLVVVPLMSLDAFAHRLNNAGISPERTERHVRDIKAQAVTNLFYLPKGGDLQGDQIARFDECYSLPMRDFKSATERSRRLASLSQLGFYLLTFKLSIHFCRMHEGIHRGV